MLRRAPGWLGVLEVALPVAAASLLLGRIGLLWWARASYPYDLEWMEGGMLAHAWRLQQGLPLYTPPGPDWAPFIYPPGYSAVVAALGAVFGLSPTVGRLVSIAGTLVAALALGWSVRRHGGGAVLALAAAAAFVGVWPGTGAFLDIVRADGLMMGALAWSAALALDGRKGTPVAAGLLLAVAFLAKHNAAAFGVPLALAILARGGLGPALAFVLASAGPALLAVGWLQLQSEGRFLTYLVTVPGRHPSHLDRVWPWTARELGTPMPFVLGTFAAWGLLLATEGQRSIRKPVAAMLPVAVGMLAAWQGTYNPPPPESMTYNAPSSVAMFTAGALPVSLGIWLVGRLLDRRAGDSRPILTWPLCTALGLAATAVLVVSVMRAHNGGFLNVHLPFFAFAVVAWALVLAGWLRARPTPGVRAAVTCVVTAQLLWASTQVQPERLRPTREDFRAGNRIVKALREVEGPVLSPYAPWLPVYAGKPPSLHYQALWDLEYPDGPFHADLQRIRDAVRDHRWPVVVGASRAFPYGLDQHYEPREKLVDDKSRALWPKTGWRARPNRLLVPKGE